MRRLFILGLLFGLMYALQFLQVGTATAFHPLSLATFGFILLAAYTLGELVGKVGLPRITGYIFTGLVFGPYVINLFSTGVVQDLRVVNDLAIGMIALSAGGEMKVSSLRQIARSLTLIVLIKGGLTLVAITLAVYAISGMLPFLDGASTPLILAVGSIFGVLAIGTSPAATIAVIGETGARGRLADTALGVAVFKDVVMVVLLAIALALTRVFSTPDGVFDVHVLLLVGEELGLSILTGAVLGGVIILYIRYIHAEMWLFIIAIIFSMTAVAHLVHLEALLMFIVAGFVVQNFSKHGDHFVHLIESVALPVYVVFFSVAGAGLDLGALAQVGVVALILVGVRLVAIFVGTYGATRLAGEPEPIQKNAWMAFVSQAGVVIGMTIIIENNLPGLGSEIRTVVLGIVAINLIAGPVLLKIALNKVGETKEQRGDGAVADDDAEAAGSEAAGSEAAADGGGRGEPAFTLPESPEPVAVHVPAPDFSAPRLQETAQRLGSPLVPLQHDLNDQYLTPQTNAQVDFLNRFRKQYQQTTGRLERELRRRSNATPVAQEHLLRRHRMALAQWLQSEVVTFSQARERITDGQQVFTALFEALHEHSQQTADRIVVMQEAERFQPHATDSLYLRFRRAMGRFSVWVTRTLGSGVLPNRTVPARRIARYQYDGLLPVHLHKVADLAAAQPFYTLEKVRVLFNEIDEHFTAVIHHLNPPKDSTPPDDEAPEPAADEASADEASADEAVLTAVVAADELVRQMNGAMEAEFDQAVGDMGRYQAEVQHRLASELAHAYTRLLDDLSRGGTFELPTRRRRYSAVHEDSQLARSGINAAFEAWAEAIQGSGGALARQLEVVTLRDHVNQIADRAAQQLAGSITDHVTARIATAQTAIRQARTALEAAFEGGSAAPEGRLEATLKHALDTLPAALQAEALDPLETLRQDQTLNAVLDRMLQRFGKLATGVPESYMVLEADDRPTPGERLAPGQVRLRVTPLRDVARSFLETRVGRRLDDANQTILQEVAAAIHALTEVQQLIRFNLQAALDELRAAHAGEAADDAPPDPAAPTDPTAKARELTLKGLERAAERLDKIHARAEDFEQRTAVQVYTSTDNLLDTIETEVAGRTELSLRFQREQQKALSRGASYLSARWAALTTWLRGVRLTLQRRFRPLAQEVLRDLRARRSLEELSPAEVLDRYDQTTLDARTVESLPFIYQKLFAFRPLDTDEFMLGRTDELDTFRVAAERWSAGTAAALAVIGAPGVGVSSFLTVARQRLPEHHPTHLVRLSDGPPLTEAALAEQLATVLGLGRVQHLSALQTALLSSSRAPDRARMAVVLDDLHHLYTRTPGGFEVLRRLLVLITTTSRQVLWVAGMPTQAWRYLDAATGVSDAFTLAIHLKPLDRATLEEALMARHRVSGLALQFRPTTLLRQRRRYGRVEVDERQAMARTAYFDLLWRHTEGHPATALFTWLRSIDAVRENTLVLQPQERIKLGYLSKMSTAELLALRLVLEQGRLTVDQYAYLLGSTPVTGLKTLMQLHHLGLLTAEGTPQPNTFSLNPQVYQPLAAELKDLNLLA